MTELSMPSPRWKTPRVRRRLAALLLALCGVLVFVGRGYHDETRALQFRDFKQPYSSARCLLRACDPYSETATHSVFLQAGGTDQDKEVFEPFSALYPPFSLAALESVAALPYPVAHAVWEALIAVTFSLAVFLIADLCATAGAVVLPTLLLAVFTASSTILLMLGQISGLVIALLGIGFACVARSRYPWIAFLCFFAAVILKPHDAAIPLLYLLFAGPRWRRVFGGVLLLSVVFAGLSLLWFAHMPQTAHWLSELRLNLHGNSMPGSANDPGLDQMSGIEEGSLQSIFAVVTHSAGLYNAEAFALSAILLAAWIVPVLRLENTFRKHTLAIAAVACLAILPIYHRQYDSRILILAFPAAAVLLAQRSDRRWGYVALGLLAIATVVTAHTFLNHLQGAQLAVLHASWLRTLLLYRPIPEIMLVLFLFFLTMLLRELRKQRSGLRIGDSADEFGTARRKP